MTSTVNAIILDKISLRYDPRLPAALGLRDAVTRSRGHVVDAADRLMAKDVMEEMEQTLRAELLRSLDTGDWKEKFRGRDVLKRFSGKIGQAYTTVRNVIVNQMKLAAYEPRGMKEVVEKISLDYTGRTFLSQLASA